MKRILFILLLPLALNGATWWVSPSGSGNGAAEGTPCSMATALAGWSSGDTITMLDGDYQGEFIINTNSVTVQAKNRWKARVLHSDAVANECGISAWSSNPSTIYGVTIDGLCVTNCLGIGIGVFGPSNTVQNCWVINCGTGGFSKSGYGIYAKSQRATLIQNNLVEQCGSDAGYDQAIYAGGTNVVVRNNVCRRNYAFAIQLNTFTGNSDQCWVYNNLCYSNAVGGASAYEMTLYSDSNVTPKTNYFFGNTLISRTDTAFYVNYGVVFFSNNIVRGDLVAGGSGTIYSGSNLTNPQLTEFASAGTGLFWLASGSTARNAAVSSVCGPVNFFGSAQASVADLGAFQYSAAYAADARTLDPSGAGANYWAVLSSGSSALAGRTVTAKVGTITTK